MLLTNNKFNNTAGAIHTLAVSFAKRSHMIGKRALIFYISVISLISSCAETNKKEISNPDVPPEYKKLKNLTVFQPSTQSYDTVLFEREQEFKSNEEVFFEGYTGDAVVDDRGRLFIEVSKPGQVAIIVFGAGGRFITKLGRYGRGPGEFMVISKMQILDNHLYIYDGNPRRISVYSLSNLSLVKNYVLKRDNITDDQTLAQLSPTGNFFIRDDKTLLKSFDKNVYSNQNKQTHYYIVSKKGQILPNEVLTLQRFHIYTFDRISKGIPLPFSMPFNRSSLIATSARDSIFTAWAEDFLVKVYGPEGNYQRSFYYPHKNSPLSLSDINVSEKRMSLLEESEVPATWPVLHTMFIDDQNRLWILTISDSKENYSGWILNTKGELLARFIWPGLRSSRFVESKPLMIAKNGYLYTRERDIREGIDQIVKHKIIFNKR